VVISGAWFLGYGDAADTTRARTLSPGTLYTEPSAAAHYAFTRDAPAVVYITGYGPTNTLYVDGKDTPSQRQH